MLNYPLVASKTMMKIKGFWPQASTDEPQVLALAELLQDAKITREDDVLHAVTALAKTESAKRNDFRPTPSMVCDMVIAIRKDRHQQERGRVPTGVNPEGSWYDSDTGRLAEEFDPGTGQMRTKRIASPESRERAVAAIRAGLAGTALDFDINAHIPVVEGVDHDSPRDDIGGLRYGVAHSERLATECRRVGIPDTEDEMYQYRWTFDPPETWRIQPLCGPWMNAQVQAMQEGKNWLAAANRRYR